VGGEALESKTQFGLSRAVLVAERTWSQAQRSEALKLLGPTLGVVIEATVHGM
jgi:hypothetical protein